MEIKGKIVLVVDDEESMRFVLGKHLEKEGTGEIKLAEGKQQAIQVLSESYIDLVITNKDMPEKNAGIELIEWIRERDENIRILFMTAVSVPDVFEKAMKAGANATLGKPFRKDELLEVIKSLE